MSQETAQLSTSSKKVSNALKVCVQQFGIGIGEVEVSDMENDSELSIF